MTPAVDEIRRAGVLAIVRATDERIARADVDALLACGVTALEVSLVTPGALSMIADLAGLPGLTVGVGTVMTISEVNAAAVAGATFVVSPTLNDVVVRATQAAGMASIPGAGTVTEFALATALGAALVKVFPASVFGSVGVRATLAALPHLRLLPTGGVTLAQVDDYLAAGAVAVGMGSELVRSAANAPDELAARLALWRSREGAADSTLANRPNGVRPVR
ncbi:MAG: bifunctional 4-hydroxy-2-oxoglutarate aldolase/2-dehydro-3-deoxy-phosphogluconate aldolase [Salinibacterium sp.]|nr:bifunctional 4-hydroxy-2-oxoglutarate aldolase/2-dehydro-3-deoxy-phosphogluconate aldolase [Salinibacterium sp.]